MENVVQGLASGMSGRYGDYMALSFACCYVLFVFSRMLRLVPFTDGFLPAAPLSLTMAAVALWTSSSSTQAPVYHQHLTMLPFLLACFTRFAGTWNEEPRAAHSLLFRMTSRTFEYTMLYCAFSQTSTGNVNYALPLVVLLAVGRSNEMFRAWKSESRKTRTERQQFGEAMIWLETWILQGGGRPMWRWRLAQPPLPLPLPQAQPSSESQPQPLNQPQAQPSSEFQPQPLNQPQTQPQPQPQSQPPSQPQTLALSQPPAQPQQPASQPQRRPSQPTRRTMPRPSNSAFQLGYLWIHGSGTLVTAALTLSLSSFICITQSTSPFSFFSITVNLLYTLAFFHLVLQCLPGLFFRMHEFANLLKSSPQVWLKEPCLWVQDWYFLLKDLVCGTTSSPFRCQELPKFLQLLLCYLETLELFLHVLIAVISRFSLHAVVLMVAWILKTSGLGNPVINMPHHTQSHILWFMSQYSKQELQLLRDHFLDNRQKLYVLVSLLFHRMDLHSTYDIDKKTFGTLDLPSGISKEEVVILEGYCPAKINGEPSIGYSRLKGTFVDIEEVNKIPDKSQLQAVAGGWVTIKDPQAQQPITVSEWGDSEPDPHGGDGVAHVYQGRHRTNVMNGKIPGDLKVFVKWGSLQDATVITHVWKDSQLVLGLLEWAPPLKDSTVFAVDVTSYPSKTTWSLAWRRKDQFFLS